MFQAPQNTKSNPYQTRFCQLEYTQQGIICEYIWIGSQGYDLRSKTRILKSKTCQSIKDFPDWYFEQDKHQSNEIILRPIFYCKDPFRKIAQQGNTEAYLVLCETYTSKGEPTRTNFRYHAQKVFNESKVIKQEPWFGFEQEYILVNLDNLTDYRWPIGFPKGGYSSPQKMYHCGNGSSNAKGRYLAEAHLKCCLYAGLNVAGLNAETFPGQWEYQIGPVEGLQGCDQLWISRYILTRLCEEYGIEALLDAKPIKGNWNGNGCHTNYSYVDTRKDRGYLEIMEAIERLKDNHFNHMIVYGPKNEARLTGKHETSKFKEFTYDIANRSSSVRIPTKVVFDKKGYLEDRRPSGDCDPYLVCSILVDTTILSQIHTQSLVNAYEKFQSLQPRVNYFENSNEKKGEQNYSEV